MDLHRIAGGLLFCALTVAAIELGGSLLHFFHVPSFLYVALGGAALWALQSGATLASLPKALTAPSPTAAQLTRALTTARAGRSAVWIMAGVAVFMSTVQILQSLDDPAAIGPLIACFLLSPLYAGIFDIFVFSILERRVVQRAEESRLAARVLEAVEAPTTFSATPGRIRPRQTRELPR
jgi:flagellar motor component MotA